jgi:cysteine desulfurase/selenocysteine lyase
LEGILAEGIEGIERHVLALAAHLVRGAEELGLEVRSCQEPSRRSGITTLGLPGGPEQELALNDHLLKNDVFVSVRYTSGVGGVRVSPHHHNSFADVDRFLFETKEHLQPWCSAR